MLDHKKKHQRLSTHTRRSRERPRGWANTLLTHKYSALNNTLDLLCCLALFAHQMCALQSINTPIPAKESSPPGLFHQTSHTSRPIPAKKQSKQVRKKETNTHRLKLPHQNTHTRIPQTHITPPSPPKPPKTNTNTPQTKQNPKTTKQIQKKGM